MFATSNPTRQRNVAPCFYEPAGQIKQSTPTSPRACAEGSSMRGSIPSCCTPRVQRSEAIQAPERALRRCHKTTVDDLGMNPSANGVFVGGPLAKGVLPIGSADIESALGKFLTEDGVPPPSAIARHGGRNAVGLPLGICLRPRRAFGPMAATMSTNRRLFHRGARRPLGG